MVGLPHRPVTTFPAYPMTLASCSMVSGRIGESRTLSTWVLDVAFSEDNSRVRVGNSPENFSVLRHMALNMLKSENTLKVGVAAKRKRAGWDENTCSKSSFSKMRLPWMHVG